MNIENNHCPYCKSSEGCQHLLLCLDTTFKQAEGGYLWEHFNDVWAKIFNENSEDFNFNENDAFNNLLKQVYDLADESSYGSAVSVTATFGFVAAAELLALIANGS